MLFGHAEAERTLLDAYRGGRVPHAWLIGGPAGIGKATLAYRMARFVLAHPDPAAAEVQARHIARGAGRSSDRAPHRGQAHPDLLVLERVINEKTGKLFTVIRVEDVRRTVPFFGSTAGEGGWRVCIVDTADELQDPQGANALLKMLEEPPAQCAAAAGERRAGASVADHPLALPAADAAAADAGRGGAGRGRRARADPQDAELQKAAALSEGSIGRALMLLEGPALQLREQVMALLDRLPTVDPRALHALGDAIGGTEPPEARSLCRHRQRMDGGALVERRAMTRAACIAWPKPGSGSTRRARGRQVQSRPQAADFRGVRLACRGRARLIPNTANRHGRASRHASFERRRYRHPRSSHGPLDGA